MYLVSFTAGELVEVRAALLGSRRSGFVDARTAREKVEEQLREGAWDELDRNDDFGGDNWAKPDCMP